MKKVTVTVPPNKVDDIKTIAQNFREKHRLNNADTIKSPGWDAKVISKISKEHFGGFEKMFIEMDWPERGSDMMRKVQRRVVEKFGSIENFHHAHPVEIDRPSPNRSSEH